MLMLDKHRSIDGPEMIGCLDEISPFLSKKLFHLRENVLQHSAACIIMCCISQ